MPREWRHFLWNAEELHDQIDQVTPQLEHGPTGILSQSFPLVGANRLAHHGVQFKDLAQPALLEKLPQHDHAGVVPIHKPHLNQQLLLLRQFEDLLELVQVVPGGLVDMDMLSRFEAYASIGQQITNGRLDQHRLQTRSPEQLLHRDPLHALERGILLGLGPQLQVRLNNTNHLVIVGLPINANLVRVTV